MRGGIHFTRHRKQRIFNGVLNEHAFEAIQDRLDITALICPVCQKYLIQEDDLFYCYDCQLAGEVVLVIDRRVADDDPQRLSLRLLQRDGTLTPKAYKHIKENDGFLFGGLPCPSCDAPITQLFEDTTGEKPTCCQVAFLPQIKAIRDAKPPKGERIQHWKVSYWVESLRIHSPTPCQLKVIDVEVYQSELAHFAPKVETLSIETHRAPAEDDRDVSAPETIPMTHTAAIGVFIRRFLVRDPAAITPRNDFYQAYVRWIQEHHQEPLGNKTFYRQLREVFPYLKSGQHRINGKRTRCYRGISLRRDADPLRG